MAQNAISKAEAKFTLKLIKAARDIKEAANGRTCEMCQHFLGTFCMRPDLENEVEIHRPDAVACSKFVAKVDGKRKTHRRR